MAQVWYPNMAAFNFADGRVQFDFSIEQTDLELRRVRCFNTRSVHAAFRVYRPDGSPPFVVTFPPNTPTDPNTVLTLPRNSFFFTGTLDDFYTPEGWRVEIASG